MDQQFNITGGIYLVLDPAMPQELLLGKLATALGAGLQVVQIWNNWLDGTDKISLIEKIATLCHQYQVPVLINEDWQLLLQTSHLDGVHFDSMPADLAFIRQTIGRSFLTGITSSGEVEIINWSNANYIDYVSFCAMFPSPSAGSCAIVTPAAVKHAKTNTQIPIFVSGGITPENIVILKKSITFDGVAVISGILSADNPAQKVQQYHNALNIKIN